jgi:hypothetical protein
MSVYLVKISGVTNAEGECDWDEFRVQRKNREEAKKTALEAVMEHNWTDLQVEQVSKIIYNKEWKRGV